MVPGLVRKSLENTEHFIQDFAEINTTELTKKTHIHPVVTLSSSG